MATAGCTACHGKGYHGSLVGAFASKLNEGRTTYSACTQCKGTGKMKTAGAKK